MIQFSGLASGIDTASLVNSLISKRHEQRITPLKNRIGSLQDTSSALQKLSDLLSKLDDAAASFRSINGGALVKPASSSNHTVVTATASGNAVNNSFTVTVNTLASNGTASFDDTDISSTTNAIAPGLSGQNLIGFGIFF